MGLNRTTTVLVGIEIDVDQYFYDDGKPIRSRFPQPFVEAAEEKLATLDFGDFEQALRGHRALEATLGNLPNGLCFMSNDGEGCEDPHYFLGQHFANTGSYHSENLTLLLSEADFQETKASVEERALEYGFEGEAILAIIDWWG